MKKCCAKSKNGHPPEGSTKGRRLWPMLMLVILKMHPVRPPESVHQCTWVKWQTNSDVCLFVLFVSVSLFKWQQAMFLFCSCVRWFQFVLMAEMMFSHWRPKFHANIAQHQSSEPIPTWPILATHWDNFETKTASRWFQFVLAAFGRDVLVFDTMVPCGLC